MKSHSLLSRASTICILLIAVSLLSGCWSFYKKKVATPEMATQSWPSVVQQIKQTRPIIQVINGSKTYDLQNYRFEEENLIGTITTPKFEYQIPDKNIFSRNNIPKSQRRAFFLTMQLQTPTPLTEGEIAIPIADIAQAQYFQTAIGVNVLTHLAVATAATTGFLIIACNCPRVYTINQSGEKTLQGTILTGAMSKSFERTDLLPLYDLDRSGKSITLTVANELPEDEFIDELQLLKVKKTTSMKVATDATRELFEYNPNLNIPIKARSLDGRDILSQVQAPDGANHNFNDQLDLPELNSAIFTFTKSDLKNNNPKLIIRANQTKLLEYTGEYAFSLFGTQFDNMYKQMDKRPLSKFEKGNSEKGIAMNVFVKTAKGWEKAGSFQDASAVKKKWLGIDIDLSKVEGENVEIKLEAAYKLWELDFVGMTSEWNKLTDYQEITLISAINEKGKIVADLLANVDKQYAIQANAGAQIDLEFKNSAKENEVYVLRGTGYYRHIRNYTHKMDKKALMKIKGLGKMAGQEVSKTIDLYLESVSMN